MAGGQARSAACLLACAAGLTLVAPPLSGNSDPAQAVPGVQDEIDSLRLQVRKQLEEITSFANALMHKKIIERILPATAAQAADPVSSPARPAAGSALRDSAPVKESLSFDLGGLTITPTGFVAAEASN